MKHILSWMLISAILAVFSAVPVLADEGKSVVFGANSTQGGYVMQVNNRGGMNYARFTSVAPVVNRLRIQNLANNSIVYDGTPAAGITIYMPQGSYRVTGWSAYGTQDDSAIVAVFTQTPEKPAAQQDAKAAQTVPAQADSASPQPAQTTVPTMDYNPGYYSPGYYYPIPYYGYPQNNNGPNTGSSGNCGKPALIWCTYCGKYHAPAGCIYTLQQNNVINPYNPYWRGGK